MTTKKQTQKPTCRNWQILLGEYVLGTIGERDRTRLEKHLRSCRRCRRALADTEKMYGLLDDFELAKEEPFFAAKVDRALKSEAGEPEAAPSRAKERSGLWRWLRAPAFISAAAAAAAALVVGTLYVKIWLPGTAEPDRAPAAPAVAPPVASMDKADVARESKDKEAGGAVERDVELTTPSPETKKKKGLLAEPRILDEFTTYDAASAAAPPSEGRPPATELYLAELEETRPAEETMADFDELMRRESGAGGTAYDGAGRGYGLAGGKATRFAAPPGAVALTASEVEGWMDPRIEVDVERLTGDEGALLDYVTPNGSLMAYFYELPVEEQRTLLSRLRREAEAKEASEAGLMPSH